MPPSLPTTSATDALEAPLLLIAMPQVLDPFFHRSVVLLVHHDGDGSLGFIVNRPTEIRLTEILQGMEMRWNGGQEAVAFFGGPVQPQLGTVLYDQEQESSVELEGSVEVASGLGLTQHVGDLERLASSPPERLRLLLGYAGWGERQLIDEILRNDWLTVPVRPDLVFADAVGGWEAAVAAAGVDPDTLPSWSPAMDEDGAN